MTRHRWARIILAPVSAVLRSGNPRDTIDRLFDSWHLNDLRLIAAAAFYLAFVVFVVAVTVAVSSCVAAWSTQTHDTFAQHGYADLIVQEKKSERTGGSRDDCADANTTKSSRQYVVHFDGSSYVLPKELHDY